MKCMLLIAVSSVGLIFSGAAQAADAPAICSWRVETQVGISRTIKCGISVDECRDLGFKTLRAAQLVGNVRTAQARYLDPKRGSALPENAAEICARPAALRSADSLDQFFVVERLYLTILNRRPDPDGERFWKKEVAKGISKAALAAGFVSSQEFINRDDLNVAQFVDVLYKHLLQRKGDKDGVAFWQRHLLGRVITREQVVNSFLQSEEFQALLAQSPPAIDSPK